MVELNLTPEDLLAGAAITHAVTVPPEVMQPGKNDAARELVVTLKPLTIGTFQLIMKASRQDASLIPLLMIKEALVQPALTLEQVKGLHLGLVNFLIGRIREISGLAEKKKPIAGLEDSALVRSSYLLARAFGWTPEQVQDLTMAQVSIYLQLLEQEAALMQDSVFSHDR